MPAFDQHRNDLADLTRANRRRALIANVGIDFASNDYLGLSTDPHLAQAVTKAIARHVPVGSGGSRLLRGNHPEHELLEEEAERFFGSEAAIFFSSGYAANTALFATLPQTGDLIVHDELVHASAHEGMRLTRAERRSAPHNDAGAVEGIIVQWRRGGGSGTAWIAVESLYSMDGDRAPLEDLAAIADRHGAILLIDEAHATGVFGSEGRGLAGHLEGRPDVVTLRTCGKALGTEGALVCGPRIVCDFLINRGRAFIFSTAPSPLMASAVRAALRIVADEPERRERLWRLIAHAGRSLAPFGVTPTGSQILPLILGDDGRAMRVAAALQAAGYDVRGIRPPTVPLGTSRLRISITLNASTDDVVGLAAVLGEALA